MLVMLAIVRRAIVIMVGTSLATQQCVLRATIRHTGVFRGHMPGGKKPPKQRQQSENAMEWAHGEPIRGTVPCCQHRSAALAR